jgi:DNA-binding CsgD family transcriptional regulator
VTGRSWNTLTQDVQHAARAALTDRQLEAWKLELAGMSQYDMALALNIGRPAVQSRLREAHRNLRSAGIVMNDRGDWTLQTRAAA